MDSNLKIVVQAALDTSAISKDLDKLKQKKDFGTIPVTAALNEAQTISKINQQLAKIGKAAKITIQVDTTAVTNAVKKATEAVTKASGIGKAAPVQIFDSKQLKAQGQEFIYGTYNIIDRVKKMFSKKGMVDVSDIFDDKGKITGFTASVTNAENVIKRYNFTLAKFKTGNSIQPGFLYKGGSGLDKQLGADLKSAQNFVANINSQIRKINNDTLSGPKALQKGTPFFSAYDAELEKTKTSVKDLAKQYPVLSDAIRTSMKNSVIDLRGVSTAQKALASSAESFDSKQFEAQKNLAQKILLVKEQQWKNAGYNDPAFLDNIAKAKATLNSAIDVTGVAQFRDQYRLLMQDVAGFKALNVASTKPIVDSTLLTNIETARLRLLNLKDTYSAITKNPELMKRWNELFASTQNINTPKGLTNFNAQFRNLEQSAISAGAHVKKFFDQLGANAAKMANWMVLGGILAAAIRGFKELFTNVIAIDTAMTELKRVTDETDIAYSRFLKNAATQAIKLGTTMSEYVNSVADFARLGYSIADASALADTATMYYEVGDGLENIDQATQSVISAMKAFNITATDSVRIADLYNYVGRNCCPAA